ncbi:MAG: simple sugar transport system substrate-binding protein [Verrucomicrobiota bacterium]|nr:simple sugar transport system substrate-binding protein [Verrucomicrobiota bacterium]
MKKIFAVMLFFVALCGLQNEARAEKNDPFEIVMVVKLEGVAWFDNMRLGIERFNAEHPDVNAYQVGANTADPAAQVALINDLIAKGVDAILVVPNDPESLVPVLKKANDAGILTFSHESSNQKQVSFDLEAFDNEAYGRHMMDVMAEWMGKSGAWQPFVGFLTSPTHNQWVAGEMAEMNEKYPGLVRPPTIEEDQENQQIAYERTLELLKKNPDLKAIMGSAMSTVPGAAAAIEEKGMIGKVAAFGTCLPSVAGDYLKSGAAKSIHFWVPADAGYALANIAYKTLKGEIVTEGMDLGAPGYNNVTIKKNKYGVPVVYGQAWVDVNADNLEEWMNPDGSYKL